MTQTAFILKILIPSTLLSVLIKYAGPSLAIPETATNVLIAVLLPSLIMASILLWRIQTQEKTNLDH